MGQNQLQLFVGVLLPVAGLLLGGCAGSGEGLDRNGRPLSESDPANLPLVATFESIQAHVFTPICSVCHSGALAPVGLRLDAANSYNLIVGVSSVEVPGVARVIPGNAQASYLVQKIEGRASVGVRMPAGGTPLPPATIAVIREWIDNGAPRFAPGAGASAAPEDSFVLGTGMPVEVSP